MASMIYSSTRIDLETLRKHLPKGPKVPRCKYCGCKLFSSLIVKCDECKGPQ